MSHEPTFPALGMISAAPCTMATVSPLTPSPISGAMVANGSPASQSGHSGFAAALRKLAKQAEEPRGECALSSRLHPSLLSPLPVMPCWKGFNRPLQAFYTRVHVTEGVKPTPTPTEDLSKSSEMNLERYGMFGFAFLFSFIFAFCLILELLFWLLLCSFF